MKTKTLRRCSIGLTILALALVAGTFFSKKAYAIPRSPGCYQIVTLDCGMSFGQWSYCNFTGAYGAPFTCTGVDCLGRSSTRHCVVGS